MCRSGANFMRLLEVVAVIAALGITPGYAGDYPPACRDFTSFPKGDLAQPAKPPCLAYLSNQETLDMCQPMMDLYQQQVRSYLECLKAENDSMIAEFNAAAARFNCAQRGHVC